MGLTTQATLLGALQGSVPQMLRKTFDVCDLVPRRAHVERRRGMSGGWSPSPAAALVEQHATVARAKDRPHLRRTAAAGTAMQGEPRLPVRVAHRLPVQMLPVRRGEHPGVVWLDRRGCGHPSEPSGAPGATEVLADAARSVIGNSTSR